MPASWSVCGRTLTLDPPLVMGIINVTPDSFSDGGHFFTPDAALKRAAVLLQEGADILDVGGESTRPHGVQRVNAAEELRRVLPVIGALSAEYPDALLSVDTTKSLVARAAIEAGAHIVNDVSGMRFDPVMAELCAAQRVGAVLMHSRGDVEEMATFVHAAYEGDPMDDVIAELGALVAGAMERGVARECIVVDPGIGFAKRSSHSLRMIAGLGRLAAWGFPMLIGASRKRFIGELTLTREPAQRIYGSIGAAVAAYDRGARIFRVHDVAATRQALDVAAAIEHAMVP